MGPFEGSACAVLSFGFCFLLGCTSSRQDLSVVEGQISVQAGIQADWTSYKMAGNLAPVLDPSVIRQGSTYYVFSTDVVGGTAGATLPIRCSADEVSWRPCGNVFQAIPAWVRQKV